MTRAYERPKHNMKQAEIAFRAGQMGAHRATRPAFWLAGCAMAAALSGCAATPEDRWFQQREALTAANRVYLAHVPVMTDEQVVHYGELLQAARFSLDSARQRLPEGGPAFETALDIVESVLIRIAALESGTPVATPLSPEDDPL